ncbi:DUF559 domain-containing protein [Nocardioides sp. SYSU DS0663]|uniref:DUF559 domain-containing protein n=1 Tax=Nocardioides sp. SYSU DS0663 TaxID=3416445 RepID=UPI003F4B5294
MLEDVLTALGGVATRAQLLAVVSRSELDRALRTGAVVRMARDRYALSSTDTAVATAHALSGVLCLTSAALHHGWAVKTVPQRPHVAVPKNRRLSAEQRGSAVIHRATHPPDDVVDGLATTKDVTLVQCLRSLPHDEALAVADSAARAGDLAALRRAGRLARGTGAARVRALAAQARAEAANPFESVLRSIALGIDGLEVEPQRLITSVTPWARPDLVDRRLRIVLEADSFEWHGDRAALRRDARRYNLLVADGWVVLRFAWEDVMHDPDHVRAVLRAVTARRTEVGCSRCPAA